jgi:hypothetical protein
MVTQVDEQQPAVVANTMAPARNAGILANIAVAQGATGKRAVTMHDSAGCEDQKVREKHTQGPLCQGDALDRGATICTLIHSVGVQKFAPLGPFILQANF